MPFPIRCPRGCLLTVDESQAGWQCQCPMCGSLFLVPPPPAAPMAGPTPYGPQRPAFNPYQPNPQAPPVAPMGASSPPQQFAPTPYSPDPQAPAPGHFPPPAQQPANHFQPPTATTSPPAAEAPQEPVKDPEPKQESLYHIPCPNGHPLEVPEEMLEKEAMCPHCQAQFRLRKKNSLEYQEERRKKAESRAENAGDIWLKGAIVMAVIVVIGLIVMIVLSS